MIPNRNRLILPLDVPSTEEAEAIVARLGDTVNFYKIGHQLMTVGGFPLAERLSADGKKVFLDLKLLDIGATVEKGVRSATSLNADFITIHADPDALKGAVTGRGDDPRLKILAVTVLTSWDQDTLKTSGISMAVEELVLHRTEMAVKYGADAVVASAKEAAAIRARFGDALQIVTPGVRPKGAETHDQKRVVTPGEAIKAGSDYLVVGRPILHADDPVKAAQTILAEIDGTLS